MKKFKVYGNSYQRFFVEIEAKDENEALDKAKETDGGDFTPMSDYGDWEIEDDTIEEVR